MFGGSALANETPVAELQYDASVFYRSIWSPVITDDLDEIAVRTGVKPGDTQADMDQRPQYRGSYLFDISKRPLKKEKVK